MCEISNKLLFRVAEEKDLDELLNFFREFYYREEPLTLSHPIPGHTRDDEEFTISSNIRKGTCLIAVDKDSGKIVGGVAAGPIEHGDADAMIEAAKTTETQKWRDISLFLAYIEKKSNILVRFNISNAVHIQALGVHRDYRGQRIGERLFKECFNNARKLNYPMVSADCTSIYSMNLSERCGMENVSQVSYDEYNDILGQKLFQPKEPNSVIKTYVKLL
jgi:N-acetylglutamate synthase-like GNAT family acetyltransferase